MMVNLATRSQDFDDNKREDFGKLLHALGDVCCSSSREMDELKSEMAALRMKIVDLAKLEQASFAVPE